MNFVLITLLMLVSYFLGYVMGKGRSTPVDVELAREHEDLLLEHPVDRHKRVRNRKKRIAMLVRKLGQVTNDDVQELLAVSHSSAWRYLDEMVADGHLRKEGEGAATVYRFK